MSQDRHIRPDFKSTALLNKIFLLDHSGRYSDLYIDKLEENNLETGYFQIERFLQRGQYEQAVDLFWQRYRHYISNAERNGLDMFRLMKSLKAFKILIMASDRDDTEQILKLMNTLGEMGYLTQMNYSGILSNAIKHRNYQVCRSSYNSIDSSLELTQGYLTNLFDIFANNDEFEMAIKILSKIESQDVKTQLCLQLISKLPPEQCWKLLDSLICILDTSLLTDYSVVPSSLLLLSGLDDFEKLSEHLKLLPTLKNRDAQKVIVYCLLSSINNNQGHFASTVFLVSFLKRHLFLDLLDSRDVDIIFHTASKYGSKMATLAMADTLKQADNTLSAENYYNIMKCQCFGTEHDGLFVAAIEYIEESEDHSLKPEMVNFIRNIALETEDPIAIRFLDNCSSIDEAKAIVDYNYLSKNIVNAEERTKFKHEQIKGFGPYVMEFDDQNLASLMR
ncbi:hypothetical protein FOA43_004292 [Brettanomyces nanus]|uniref:Uncharacterized protein n=1 Tax=Eeniella nana TaxID=13502 RepID=A0A875S7H0_EENNA|nr:uncharacterized protein FOA43_004292 [Brettanomyces nanus]QPG76898.1 hypothetical protein FOA43_004292 [Brettanomyces nanus]